jgi:hypothetical protein
MGNKGLQLPAGVFHTQLAHMKLEAVFLPSTPRPGRS